jgi:hypothetical protein
MINFVKLKNWILLVSFFLLSTSYGHSQTVWFSILSTETEIATAVEKKNSLSLTGGSLELVNCEDCKNLRPGLILLTTGIKKDKSEANADIMKWRQRGIKDAYLRSCDVLPNSRLALGIPLLDPSIYGRPEDVVNWQYENAVSRVKPLDNSWIAIIQPKYESTPDDILEGLRINIGLLNPNEKKIALSLSKNCIDPVFSADADNKAMVAVSCVNETAADHLLHKTLVYHVPSQKKVFEKDRCKNPRLSGNAIICDMESLDKHGDLHLETKTFELK